ncbi:MAG: hypothetical protein ACYCU0_04150 [Solirubrobacteraceae bacterium]
MLESPLIRFNGGQARYGWIDPRTNNLQSPSDGDEIALTIAGMAHVARAAPEVEVFLDVLATLVDEQRSFAPHPTEIQKVSLTSATLSSILRRPRMDRGWDLDVAEVQSIRAILEREPATWLCQFEDGNGGEWTVLPPPFLRHFRGITSSAEYVERLRAVLAPPVAAPAALHPSSLSLPEAIDYLNAVWRAYAGAPLLSISRADAAAKLALDCANADEFETRLSAICSILAQLELPEASGNAKLTDLKTHLHDKLPDASAERAAEAIDDLRAFFDLRAWRQHSGSRPESQGRRGMERLGVELPAPDWCPAWHHLQARAVTALGTLREETQTLT